MSRNTSPFYGEVPLALAEIRRVLRATGSLMVVGPDIDCTDDPEVLINIGDGARRWTGDEHQWVSSSRVMRQMLTDLGWRVIEWPIEDVPDCWPVASRVEWQFALEAI